MKKSRLSFQFSLGAKLRMVFVLIVVIALAPHAFWSVQNIEENLAAEISARLSPIAKTAASLVDPERHARVVESYRRQDAELSESYDFKEIQRALQKVQRANELTSDLFTVVRPDWKPDSMIFVAMSSAQPFVGTGVPLTPAALKALDKGKTAITSLYEDRGGKWVTAFAPIFKQDKVVGAVKVDYAVDDELRKAQIDLAYRIGIPFLIAAVLVILLSTMVTQSLSRPAISLGPSTEEFERMQKKFEEAIRARDLQLDVKDAELTAANLTLATTLSSVHEAVMIFGREGKILPNFSEQSKHWFPKLSGETTLWEILDIAPQELPDLLPAVFNGEVPFETAVAPLPTSWKTDGGARLRLTYYPVKNADGKTVGLTFIATERTKEHEAQLVAEKSRLQMKTIGAIVKLRSPLARFIRRTGDFLRQSTEELREDKSLRISYLGAGLHEIRHQAEMFSLTRLQSLAHEYEIELSQMKEAPSSIVKAFRPRIVEGVQKVKEAFEDFLLEYEWLIGPDTLRGERVGQVALPDLLRYVDKLAAIPAAETIAGEIRDQLITEPLQTYFQNIDVLVGQLARDGEKQIDTIDFVGGTTRVVPEPLLPLFQHLEDAFRNAIQHGIETPDERTKLGKPPRGRVTVTFGLTERNSQIPAWLTVAVEDDGRGIDPDYIRAMLHDPEAPDQSDHQIIQHVFDDNFTTATERGPFATGHGLSALRRTVTNLGGLVEIHSTINQGTVLTVMIPIPDTTPHHQKAAA